MAHRRGARLGARRLLATESLDPASPFFRWLTPGFDAPGWQAWSLPTIEAVEVFGLEPYRRALVQAATELQADVLLTLPPFDFLDQETSERLRAGSTRIVGWLDDEALAWTPERLVDLAQRHDRLVSPGSLPAALDAPIRRVPWTLSAASVSAPDPAAPRVDVALIAPHTEAREALARRIAAAGREIACFGVGWALGPLTRPSRLGLMSAAKVTIVFEDQALLLEEGARLGARLLVERGAGPRGAAGEGGPVTFADPDECLALLADLDALPEWRAAPGWSQRWSHLIDGLAFGADEPAPPRSPALAQLHAAIAHASEHRGLLHAARAAFEAWAAIAPDDPGPLAGQARIAAAAEEYELAADKAREALLRTPAPPPALRDLRVYLRRRGPGSGLGRSGALDPRAELRALLLGALVEDARFFDALEEVRPWSPEERAAVRGAFVPRLSNHEAILLDRILGGDLPLPPRGAAVQGLAGKAPTRKPSSRSG